MPGRLEGKVALITGAARGQGEAEARRFVAEGAKVVLADVLADEGELVAKELGDAAVFARLDISDQGQWSSAVGLAKERFGQPIDVLVNNAAVTLVEAAETTSWQQYQRTMDVNVGGVLLGMQAVHPGMVERGGGSIINISSAAALAGTFHMSVYTASKAAVLGLTRVISREWGPAGIRVNAILPGAVDTPMLRGPHTAEYDVDALCASVPIPRAGRPSELAAAVLFLASDESSYITGVALPVDGGRSASWAPERRTT